MSLNILNNSFYGIPLGIYAMIGVTTGVLAIMTLNDSTEQSSSTSESIFHLPNGVSSSEEPEEVPEPEEPPVAMEEPPVAVADESQEVPDENKMMGGKKKKKTKRNNKSKSKSKSRKTIHKKTKQK